VSSAKFSALAIQLGLEDQGKSPKTDSPSSSLRMANELEVEHLLDRISIIAAEATARPDDQQYFIEKIWWLSELAKAALAKREVGDLTAVNAAISYQGALVGKEGSAASILLNHRRMAAALPDRVIFSENRDSILVRFLEQEFT
jgi:hypothetical protein